MRGAGGRAGRGGHHEQSTRQQLYQILTRLDGLVTKTDVLVADSAIIRREVQDLGTWARVVTIPHASPPFAFVSQQLRDNEAAKVSADQVALKVIMVEFEKAEVLMSEKLHGVSAKQDEMSEKLDGVSAKQDKIIAIATAAAATIAAAAVAIAAAAVAPAFATACAAARTTTRAAR